MTMLYVGDSASSLAAVSPDPSEMTYGYQDVSSSDAGRTQSGTMYKMKVCQKVTLDLAWWVPELSVATAILQAFDSEYFYVRYFDPKEGAWTTKEFYCGDRTAPVQWFNLDDKGTRFGKVSFNIIER